MQLICTLCTKPSESGHIIKFTTVGYQKSINRCVSHICPGRRMKSLKPVPPVYLVTAPWLLRLQSIARHVSGLVAGPGPAPVLDAAGGGEEGEGSTFLGLGPVGVHSRHASDGWQCCRIYNTSMNIEHASRHFLKTWCCPLIAADYSLNCCD